MGQSKRSACRGMAVVFLTCAAFAAGASASDATLAGKVVDVIDGDSLVALVSGRHVDVRLVEIDAPEWTQPYGEASKHSLASVCLGKPATLRDRGLDANGRTLARVECAGVDANEEQVRRGMAWVYDRYVTDRSLYIDQNLARSANRGLWADEDPTPPWEWRHSPEKRHLAAAPVVGAPSAPEPRPLESDCSIKGNISNRGERIYHLPGQRYYNATHVDQGKGERWFCSEKAARAAGWRRSKV